MSEELRKQRRKEISKLIFNSDFKTDEELLDEFISQEKAMLKQAKKEAREEFAREAINIIELKKVWTDKMLLAPVLPDDFWNKALETTIEIINNLLRGDK